RLASASAEGCFEDRQRKLTWPALVLEAILTRSAVDRQIGLGVLELVQESVLEDIDFVLVVTAPDPSALVANVTSFQAETLRQLTLDTERPIGHIGRAQVGLDAVEVRAAKGKQRLIERLRERRREGIERRKRRAQRQ